MRKCAAEPAAWAAAMPRPIALRQIRTHAASRSAFPLPRVLDASRMPLRRFLPATSSVDVVWVNETPANMRRKIVPGSSVNLK